MMIITMIYKTISKFWVNIMVKKEKSKEKPDFGKQSKDMFNVCADNYTGLLKMYGDSQMKLYKPWIESMGELSDKAFSLSSESVPEKYKEFFDEWIKTYQSTFGKFYPLPTMGLGKEAIESLISDAEESNRLYKSWIAELERNSRKSQEALTDEPSAAKYKECYDMWMASYEKMFNDFLSLPPMKRVNGKFEDFTGISDIHSETGRQFIKMQKDSYSKLFAPWIQSMLSLSEKAGEISRGNASPDEYKEFYTLWTKTYQDNCGKLGNEQFMKPSKETLDNFIQSVNIYLNMYRSWISALEKMSEKSKELSNLTTDPQAYQEFCDLWVKMYEKAFDSFFEDMPMVGPMKETMEPVKIAAKTYADAYVKMTRMWTKSAYGSQSRA